MGVAGGTEVLVWHVVGAAGDHQRGDRGPALVAPGAGPGVLPGGQLGDQHALEAPWVLFSDRHSPARNVTSKLRGSSSLIVIRLQEMSLVSFVGPLL